MKQIYIAYSMTNSRQDISVIEKLVEWLNKKQYKIIRPSYFLFPDSVIKEALKSISSADLIIADVSEYSHGVGFEIGYSFALGKKIVIICNISSKKAVSGVIRGLFQRIIYYHSSEELIEELSTELKSRKKTLR